MNSSLNIKTMQIVGSVNIEDTVREGVGDVTSTLLLGEFVSQFLLVVKGEFSPLFAFFEFGRGGGGVVVRIKEKKKGRNYNNKSINTLIT